MTDPKKRFCAAWFRKSTLEGIMQLKGTRRSCDANYRSEAVRLAIDRNNVMSDA